MSGITNTVDSITLELIKGSVRSARLEMEALIERTSMSPFIREKKDYFTALYDAQGNLVSGIHHSLAGNLLDCVFEYYPAETIRPGDLFAYNDPYTSHGAVSHSPDMVFVAPAFHEERLVGFSVSWGHLWDIGGMVPGSISPDATDNFQEGIQLPPVKFYSAGALNQELFRTFLRNSRFPEMVKGDVQAIMGSCRLGRQRMEEIFQRFGAEATAGAFSFIMHQSEAALRQALEITVPDGRYSFRDFLDSDAVTDDSPWVQITLEKQGGRVTMDFSESSDQAKGPVNFIMHESVPKFMCGLYLTSDDPTIMLNAGYARAMGEVKTRKGSLVDPVFPAPLGMRAHTRIRVQNALFGALAQATDGDAPAASSVYVIYYLRSYEHARDSMDLCIEGLAVGFGARPFADGIDAVYSVAQKNYPVEFAEMEFGMRVEAFRIHRDSGGPGRYRGGCGIIRDIRITGDEGLLGLRLENVKFPAWGVKGGRGAPPCAKVVVNPDSPDARNLKPLSDQNRLKRGDLIRVMTAGGGGWGDPLERPAENVLEDVQDGFVSRESAFRDYGVVLDENDQAVNEEETAKLRKTRKCQTGMFHRRGRYYESLEPFHEGEGATDA
ncbi:MAG: hydantoinase B/oxoprolinase family protein [SAR324 cluster bacterium]|nr:hydantoinase B/oxoprolinase family protein [SAR324 cluster bacterium]